MNDPISIRPSGARPLGGHLIAGSNISYIATLVKRHSRCVMLDKVKKKDTESVVSALIKQANKLPTELYKSLTWARGKELSDHKRFTLKKILTFTFVTLAIYGSVVPMRTLIVCLGSVFQKILTYQFPRKLNLVL
jgi:hypothetical protein